MPPKQRITREMILESSFSMFCREGMENVNARSVAKALGCSTQPIFSYFSDLMITYFVKDRSEAAIMRALNIKNSFGMRRFNTGRRNYNAYQVIEIIRAIRRFAAQSKGCGSRQNEYLLLRELVFHILTAPGNLWQR